MTPRAQSSRAARAIRTIGRYALYGEIASGGMATVHLGRLVGAVGFSRPVAIKRLHPQFTKDPELRAMFIDEARLVARIRHQNVVPTLDVVAEDDELFLVMEYVEGESLWRLMKAAHDRRTHIPPRVALTLVSHVLHGLHAAHEARTETGEPLEIVHRDVSPQNVLVGTDGSARVLDFGIAHAAVRSETTREGRVKGKLSYIAPEQLGGAPVTRRADLYATSVILWELVTGRRLFARGDTPEALLVDKLFRAHIPRPSDHNEHLPPGLDPIVLRGLARDPLERFATAREMAVALEGLGELATPSEVGEWVERLAREGLDRRARQVAAIESARPPSGREVHTPSTSPMVASIAPAPERLPPSPAPPDLAEPEPPTVKDRAVLEEEDIARASPKRARRSLASILEPDLDEKVLARVRLLATERKRVLVACVAAVGGFVALVGGVGAGAHAVSAPGSGSNAQAGVRAVALRAPASLMEATTPCPGGMVAVPGGRFFMGSDDDLPAERPAHHVALAPYCIGALEVTTDEYRACSDRGECKRAGTANDWAGIGSGDRKTFDPLCNARDTSRGRHPINCVDWEQAAQFCAAQGGRLPTEAEWEFAARGADGRKYPWGDEPPGARFLNACGRECVEWGRLHRVEEAAMFSADDGWATTAPVGSFPEGQSRFGARDMVGNVWEWVSDWYGAYSPGAEDGPRGPAQGRERVIRGGAWNGAYADWVRPTFRYKDPPDTRSYGIGFRCAADQGRYSRDVRVR